MFGWLTVTLGPRREPFHLCLTASSIVCAKWAHPYLPFVLYQFAKARHHELADVLCIHLV
jgi:hypothetical protein